MGAFKRLLKYHKPYLSFVDAKTEQEIQEALDEAMKGRTCFIIAHRLSTIRLCDEIMVIDQGKIVEVGTHAELMKKNGLYSSFYRMQFREEKGFEKTLQVQ